MTSLSSSSPVRRIAFLAAFLMLLIASGAQAAQAATPAPAPATAPSGTPGTTSSVTPKAAALPAPAPKKAAPRALGPQALPSATLVAPNCQLTCDLYAKEGTISLPGPTTVPIWGFTSSASGAATLPGPTLITIAGQPLSITLHNMLPAADGNVALEVPGAVVPRDAAEVASGGAPHAYNLNGLSPGTYIYEAGATSQGARQVAMGLSGILIVRPADWSTSPNTAYGATSPTPGTFNAEATVLVSEIDSEFNNDPLNKDLIEYRPTFFLVNGHAFDRDNPTAGKIDVVAGNQLLLHEANLGLRERSVGILGARQSILANDSRLLKNATNVATNFLTPGQVSDAFVQVDPSLTTGTQLPLYDGGLHFNNEDNSGLGGMLTYLDVLPGVGGVAGGPVTSNIVAAPQVNDGTQATIVTGITSAQVGNVTAAEWFLDNVGAAGSGHPITVTPGPTAPLNLTITAADLLAAITASSGTPDADHITWVHGKDASNWGEVSGDVFTLNVSGPLISAITLHPARTNGSLPNDQDGLNNGIVMATAEASLSGWTVDSAEFCIDNPACATGSGTAMTVGPVGGADIVSLSGTILATALLGLPEGAHTVYIHAHEIPAPAAIGRWGALTLPNASASLVIDKTGPAASSPVVQPTPNNGTLNGPGNLGFLNSVRATVSLSDAATGGSQVVLAEAFLGALPPTAAEYGSGAEMVPASGQWGGVSQTAYAYIPLAEINARPEGIVNIWMHGKDSAGNWGEPIAAQLTLDKTSPVITATIGGGITALATVQVTASDPTHGGVRSNIAAAEWWIGADPGLGSGTAVNVTTPSNPATFSFPVIGQVTGATVSLRVQDAAGNWSNTSTQLIP
jgi:FtsP/CotA-like multicopper oxidase with cupredoxin domain